MKRNKDNPVAPLSVLMGRVKAVAKEHGFDTRSFAVIPAEDEEGPHHVQFMSQLTDELPAATQVKDDEFEAIIAADAKASQHEKADQARDDLAKLKDQLKDPGKGILDM